MTRESILPAGVPRTARQVRAAELRRVDREHVVHSWTSQDEYEPMMIERADGIHLWDDAGNRYVDLTSQAWYANIGHGNRRVASAIAEQVGRLAGIYRFGTEPKSRLTEKLLSLLPESYDRVFFGCNGSDAVEVALKVARLVTGRQQVISFYGEYHGASMGATSVTGIAMWRAGTGQPVPGTIFVPPPNRRDRAPGTGDGQREVEVDTLAHLRRTIEQTGPDSIAAVIGEPFVTAGPLVFPSQGYWREVRKICDDYGLLLVSDEVVSAFGRAGHWFARDHYDYEPDIICLGKGLTSGYLPLSAAVFSRDVSAAFSGQLLPHGLTYSGHPVCCAAALANIEVIEEEGLIGTAADLGAHLGGSLAALCAGRPIVERAGNLGLFAVVELRDPEADPADVAVSRARRARRDQRIMSMMQERGVLVRAAQGQVSFAPPLVMSEAELDEALSVLGGVLDAIAVEEERELGDGSS